MEKLLNIRLIAISAFLFMLFSCKERITSQNNSQRVNSNELAGKTFYYLNETENGKEYVYDRCMVGVELIRFEEKEIHHYKPVEWGYYQIENYMKSDKIITYELKNKQVGSNDYITYKFIFDGDNGILKAFNEGEYNIIYIDSTYLFNKNKNVANVKYRKQECEVNFKEKSTLTDKEFVEEEAYLEESVVGHFDADTIDDKILVVDISTDDNLGGHAKQDFIFRVLLGTTQKDKYRLLLESNTVIPCNNCDEWANDAEYSFSDLILKSGNFSFVTTHSDENVKINQRFNFKLKNGNMVLQNIEKETINFDDNDRKEKEIIHTPKSINLQDFNIYNYR